MPPFNNNEFRLQIGAPSQDDIEKFDMNLHFDRPPTQQGFLQEDQRGIFVLLPAVEDMKNNPFISSSFARFNDSLQEYMGQRFGNSNYLTWVAPEGASTETITAVEELKTLMAEMRHRRDTITAMAPKYGKNQEFSFVLPPSIRSQFEEKDIVMTDGLAPELQGFVIHHYETGLTSLFVPSEDELREVSNLRNDYIKIGKDFMKLFETIYSSPFPDKWALSASADFTEEDANKMLTTSRKAYAAIQEARLTALKLTTAPKEKAIGVSVEDLQNYVETDLDQEEYNDTPWYKVFVLSDDNEAQLSVVERSGGGRVVELYIQIEGSCDQDEWMYGKWKFYLTPEGIIDKITFEPDDSIDATHRMWNDQYKIFSPWMGELTPDSRYAWNVLIEGAMSSDICHDISLTRDQIYKEIDRVLEGYLAEINDDDELSQTGKLFIEHFRANLARHAASDFIYNSVTGAVYMTKDGAVQFNLSNQITYWDFISAVEIKK